jgi:hypothetical protein
MRLGLTLGAIAVALAAINGIYNWSSEVAWCLCLLIAVAVVVYVNELHETIPERIGEHRWKEVVLFFWGLVLALVLITAVEVYLAYFFYCSAEFEDSLLYRICPANYGAYFSRPQGLYGPGEREIVSGVNFIHEHAHEIDVWLIPLALFVSVIIAEILHRSQPQPATAGGEPLPRWRQLLYQGLARSLRFMGYLLTKVIPVASAGLLALSFFAFGGVVIGNQESYRATVAMLNANTEMRGNLGDLPTEIAAKTQQIETLTKLLGDDTSTNTDGGRAKWREELRQLVQDLRRLDAELKKARALGASGRDLDMYEPENVMGSERAPDYREIQPIDARDLYRSVRRYEPPVIQGPVEPSGAESKYKDAKAGIDDFNHNLLPRYETAKDMLTDAVYRGTDVRYPEEAQISRTAATVVVRAGARNPEDRALQEVTATDQRIAAARDHLACHNLVAEFNRLISTPEGQQAIRKIISDNVASPGGFVPTQLYLTKVHNVIGDFSPDQISEFGRELGSNSSWQDMIRTLAGERRAALFTGEVSGRFNESILGAFRNILGLACAARLSSEQLGQVLKQLGSA